ncbi:putative phytol kinase, chloroplastic [Sesamum alatum]|uniref:Phytol kinase, chloroplastic n=1 Tax=Sesamum alatum TaxID=300844 RepID=A0AAE2CDC9_9LAMI|nr:putative phytol kinase, chloroplastic [Sesamum alatum]
MADSSMVADFFAAAFSYAVCLLVITFFKLTYDLALIHVHLLRKLSHISVGLIVMLCWPMFRDLVGAALGYVLAINFITVFYWRTPLAIAAICNLCAGDGVADVAGRRFGGSKLPYNKSKTFAGSFGMALAGFFASLLYMFYFWWLEYIEASPNMVLGFFLVSVASALVESLPLTAKLDDNLTVPIATMFVATFLPEAKPRRRSTRRELKRAAAMFSDNTVVNDVIATGLSGGISLSLFKLWEQTAKRGVFDQKLNRKLVHVTLGSAFMLCWPMFSSGRQGAILAALIPGINIIRMLLLGLGIWKDDAAVKSMSRFGDCRELLKGPLYYASTITLANAIYWRTSPIAVAAVCNLCAGDGMADIVGRRFGSQKLPYNQNKSVVGSITMACAGFLASVGYMFYFSSFGYIQESTNMVLGFLIVSIAAALVESHPLSTELDDNLTVPLAVVLVGSLVL